MLHMVYLIIRVFIFVYYKKNTTRKNAMKDLQDIIEKAWEDRSLLNQEKTP